MNNWQLDQVNPNARELPTQELPHDALRYLYNSRYCEVDRFSNTLQPNCSVMRPGWSRVQAVCDWGALTNHSDISMPGPQGRL